MSSVPKKPYLVRALYDWIVASEFTPHLLVRVDDDERVRVPLEFVSDGKIVLNVAPRAVRDLDLGREEVSFSARFRGQSFPVHVPMSHLLAIYAKESGDGMVFEAEQDPNGDDDPGGHGDGQGRGTHLKVVK